MTPRPRFSNPKAAFNYRTKVDEETGCLEWQGATNNKGYGQIYVDPQAEILLATSHPESTPALAWVRRYGKARIAYIQLGHGPSTYACPEFRRLLGTALHWVAIS